MARRHRLATTIEPASVAGWEPGRPADYYLRLAAEERTTRKKVLPIEDELYSVVAGAVDHARDAAVELLAKDNWAVERPAICISAWVNKPGNLAVDWRPAKGAESRRGSGDEPHQFKEGFLRSSFALRIAWHQRPGNELMRVKRFQDLERGYLEGRNLTLLLFAVRAAYEDLVTTLGGTLSVVCTRMDFVTRPNGLISLEMTNPDYDG